MALRTEHISELPNVREVIKALAEITPEENWAQVVCTIWAIWRCRNDRTYSAIDVSFPHFKRYLAAISLETRIFEGGNNRLSSSLPQEPRAHRDNNPRYTCQVDGSWVANWEGGIGYVLKDRGVLMSARSKGVHVSCPIQAEALAISEAVKQIRGLGITECSFETDSKTVAEALMSLQPPANMDWRAFREVWEVWQWFKESEGYTCKYVPRTQNETADILARRGTREKWDVTIFTFPLLLSENE